MQSNADTATVSLVRAYVDETDTFVKALDAHSRAVSEGLRAQSKAIRDEATAARANFVSAVQNAFEANRVFLPAGQEELQKVQAGVERSLSQWSELCETQEEVGAEQLNSLTSDWDQLLEEYRVSVAEPLAKSRELLVDHMDTSGQRAAEMQNNLAACQSAPWTLMIGMLVQSRKIADAATAQFQDALTKLKNQSL